MPNNNISKVASSRFTSPSSSFRPPSFINTGTSTRRTHSSSTCINQSSGSAADNQAQALKRRDVRLPLLDLYSSSTISDQYDKILITPLPASHLPVELSTLNIYGMQLKAAIHKMMIDDTLSKAGTGLGLNEDIFSREGKEPMYGHLIGKLPSKSGDDNEDNDGGNTLIGAIGCAAEIIISTPSDSAQIETLAEDGGLEMEKYSDFDDPFNDGNTEDATITVLTKGSFRFVVKEVIQTFPYPIAIVDQLLDDLAPSYSDNDSTTLNDENDDEDEDEDDDDDYDMYSHLNPSELMQRTMSAMKAIVDQKLDTKPKLKSPLEESILEQSGMAGGVGGIEAMQQNQVEEMAAIFDVFSSSLIDIAPSRTELFYTVAMLAAEFGGFDNDIRKKMILTVDGVERLRIVVEALEKKISLVQAKKLTEDITGQSDEDSKDLRVGKPPIPDWAKSFSEGMEIEYYWSEKDGWLSGTITETTMIVDELIISVIFEDGETVRLPFDTEQKARWRPAT